MKNLNKKISAVALASIVVLGGVAASGAKSFADSVKSSVEQAVQNKGIQEVNEEIKKARYKQSSFSYIAFDCFADKEDARMALNKYNRANNKYMPLVDKNLGKNLNRFSKSGVRAFALGYNNRWYIVGLPDLL